MGCGRGYAFDLLVERIVLALQGTAALCVFCVICGSILLSDGQTALRGTRTDVRTAKFILL